MQSYTEIFQNTINNLKNENRYRIFKNITRNTKTFPVAVNDSGKKIKIWCTNDYLGLGIHPNVLNAAQNAIQNYGAGSGGTRNISGNHSSIVELEQITAKLNGKESALVFTSGYVANIGAISAITKIIPNIVIFSDSKNHASIISGIKFNKTEKHIFNHNDVTHLEELISQYPIETPKLIIFEGIYSMDGTIANIQDIVKVAKKYNAMTFIDEVHAVALYGSRGGGITNLFNLEKNIDIIQGNFAKGLGVIGGYIAGNATIIDAIRSVASDFIFTTSLPPAICEACIAAIKVVMSEEGTSLRAAHQKIVSQTKDNLAQVGLSDFLMSTKTHIIPVLIKDAKKAELVSNTLYNEHNIYAQHINYPTVEKGTERIRITPTPYHSQDMINELSNCLLSVIQKI